MAAKIRLKKVGRKGQPSYRVVVLDGRKPRDAKVVADLGHYDPKTDPPSFEVDNEVALKWLLDGAKATKAARNILSKAGVMAAWNAVARGGAEPEQAQELAAQVAEGAKKKEKKKTQAKAKAKAKAKAAEADAEAAEKTVAETEEEAETEESVENGAEAPEASAEEKS
jgi:small subunit ribosomal protein S16